MTTHIYLVIDESGSMGHIARQAQETAQIWVSAMSADPDTRVSLAYFNYSARWPLDGVQGGPGRGVIVPALHPGGGTALRDAFLDAIQRAQLQLNMDPDASALIIAVTDGEENQSRRPPGELHRAIEFIRATGRADLALMVPPGQRETARRVMGLATEDVREWEATTVGVARAEAAVSMSYQAYRAARASGARSVGRFFVDAAAVTKADLKRATALPVTRVREFPVHAKARIDEFATARTGNYVVGEWYYQLTKPETIQSHKRLLLDDNGVWYEGAEVRNVLGLGGATGDLKVAPAGLAGGRRIFVQSTATNRNLIPGQSAVRLLP